MGYSESVNELFYSKLRFLVKFYDVFVVYGKTTTDCEK